jgi:hypothetical protein
MWKRQRYRRDMMTSEAAARIGGDTPPGDDAQQGELEARHGWSSMVIT